MLKSDTSPKLTIIGAGLVGCLAAKYLVKCGFDVTIYENRNDIRKQPIAKGKSINLALSNRGLTALENAGIDVKSLLQISSVPMKGRMIHNENGFLDALLYDVKYKRCIYSIGRNDLNKLLITEAEKVAELNFGCKLLNVDFRNKTLTILRIDNDTQINEKFEHLVGCDGAYSVIRQCMIKTPLFNYNQTYIDHGYIELRINPKISSENNMSVDYLHIWPRRTFMIIALPNQDKSWTVTLFMPFKLFYNIKTSEDLIRFFHKYFIDVLPLIGEDNLIHSFFCSKPQPLVSVKCNRYNINSHTLIIGDAAHAVVPFYGQGMNAGFEDCYILYSILKEIGIHSNGFEEFSKIRCVDGNAISDLSMYNYLEMRNLVQTRSFRLIKKIDDILYRCLPRIWKPLYICVTFSDIPYSECLKIHEFQKKMLQMFGIIISCFVVLAIFGLQRNFRS